MVAQIVLQDKDGGFIAYMLIDEFIVFKRDEWLNGSHTLEIELPITHGEIQNIIKYNRILFKDQTLNKWYEFVIKVIEKNTDSVKIFCESSLYDTLYSFVDYVGFNSNLILSGLNQILNAAVPTTQWQAGNSDISGYFNLQATRKNLKEVIWQYLVNTQGYIEERIEILNGVIIGRYIDVLSRRGVDRGKVIYDDREISEVNVKIPDKDIYTAAFGYGKNEDINTDGETETVDFSSVVWTEPVNKPAGQKWVGLPDSYKTAYGINDQHRMTAYENSEITEPEALLNETYYYLLENISDKTEYSIQAADLKALGYEVEEVRIGDTIGVQIGILGIKVQADIIRYQENYIEPDQNDFELANHSNTFMGFISSQNSAIINLKKENQVLRDAHMAGVLYAWNNEINGTGGYVYTEDGKGILTYDAIPSSATKVVEIKGGSIRIANSKVGGEWDWQLAMTGDGIIADVIHTGLLKSLNGQSEISIDNGTFNLGNGRLVFDGSNFTINYSGTELETVLDGKAEQSAIDEIGQYMSFSPTTGVTLGKTGSPMQITISNSEMGLWDQGAKVAHINGQKMLITSAEITNILKVGVHQIEKYNSEITLIKYVG